MPVVTEAGFKSRRGCLGQGEFCTYSSLSASKVWLMGKVTFIQTHDFGASPSGLHT